MPMYLNMEETTSHRDIIALAAVGALAVLLVWWFGFRSDEVYNTPLAPAVVRNSLPADLRVFSGKVTDRSGSAIKVEWVVPGKTDLSEIRTVIKNVSWSENTVFELTRVGESNPGSQKAKPADLKAGQAVLIVATTPVQAGDNLTAEKIQIILPPKLP